MNSSSSDDTGKDGTAAAAARPAKGGKKGKAARGDKGERNEVLAEVRRLAQDLTALRSEFARLRSGAEGADGPGSKAAKRGASAAGAAAADTPAAAPGRDAAGALADQLRALVAATGTPAVATGYALPAGEAAKGNGEAAGGVAVATGADLLREEARDEREARAARLGFALSSPQKLALARLLLVNGPQGAAQLGAGAGLTTGSLYHHLRDMQHAGVIAPAGRSRFALTPLGSHAALTLLALAARHPAG